MKIILTEDQYKIIERIIDEAAIPFSKKIEKGGYIQVVYSVGEKEINNTLKVSNVYGGGKFVEGVNKTGKYIVNVTGSLDEENNTFTVLKDGEYQDGGKTSGGKIISPKVVGGTKITIKNVIKLVISDSGKNVVDDIYTKKGEVEREVDDSGEEDTEQQLNRRAERAAEKKSREKRVLDLVMSDPTLKRAFYHQPTILKGLMNYGKAKGIGPAKDLIDKYINNYQSKDKVTKAKDEWSEFKVNKSVMFEIAGKSVRMSYGEDNFNLLVGKNYSARYVGKRYLKGKHDGHVFKIYMKENSGSDIYRGTIKGFFKEDDDSIVDKMSDIVIRIKDYNY